MKKLFAILALVAFTGAKLTTVVAATTKTAIVNTDDKDKDKKKGKDAKCAKKGGKSCCASAHAEGASTEKKTENTQTESLKKAEEAPKKK